VGTYTTVFERSRKNSSSMAGNLTLYFEGSYNCEDATSPVRSCYWSLTPKNSSQAGSGFTFSGEVKAEDGKALFTYNEKNGRIALTIPDMSYTYSAGDGTTAQETKVELFQMEGTYALQLRFSNDEEGSEEETQSYTFDITFNN
jgi:hypothetical protein